MDKQLLTYIEERAQNIERYSNKIKACLEEIEVIIDETVGGIGYNYTDSEVLSEEYDDEAVIKYRLCMRGNGIYIQVDHEFKNEYEYLRIYEVSRYTQKQIIKRLPIFMRDYAKKIDAWISEYNDVSELAEKMFSAMKAPQTKYKYGSIYKPE